MEVLQRGHLLFKDAIVWGRNFAGKADKFTPEGKRSFCMFLSHDDAEKMKSLGWTVKYLKPREDGDEPTPFIKIVVGYKYRPPKMNLISSGGLAELDEELVDILDFSDFKKVDLIVEPYNWTFNGKSGRTAYVNSFFGTLDESPLDLAYAEVPRLGGVHLPMIENPLGNPLNDPAKVIAGGVEHEEEIDDIQYGVLDKLS